MFEFEWSWVFLLFPLPWLLRAWLPAREMTERDTLRVPFFQRLKALQDQSLAFSSQKRRHLLAALIWTLLLLAAANPVRLGEPQALPSNGRDLLLAVDISGSMREEDMVGTKGYQTRLDAVKQVVSEFIERRRGDRIGLILFGERAYLQTPLTFDRNTVATQLQEAQIGFAGNATAIGDAIGIAIKNLRDRSVESRVLILLTDGANTAGSDPLQATKVAADERLRIHTIGVGDDRQPGGFFDFGLPRTTTDLDETALTQIAEVTGGRYFRARDPDQLAQIYDLIDQLEPLPEDQFYRPRHAVFYWPLGASVLLALSSILLLRWTGSTLFARGSNRLSTQGESR